MIYKFHAFELLPWGAILNIKCKSSSKEVNAIDSYISETTWTSKKEALGKDRSFFIESKKEPISMTYTVNSKNGDLVEVQTNLSCTTSKNSSGIITEFTLNNTNWFNSPFITDNILIEKKIQKVKFTLNNIPYSTNQNYLKFYVNNNQINYSNYIDKTFYFNTNSIVNENSSIRAVYNIINEIEENITSVTDPNYNNYGRAYVNKGVSQVISIYNITKQKEISNISPSYDTQNGQYYFRIRINTNTFEIGNILKIKYKCYEKAIEEINTIAYNNYYGKGYISMAPISSNNSFYNITKGVNISSAYSYYDSTEQKYAYRFTVNNTYAIGDKIRVVYYYLIEAQEVKKAIEAEEYTLHEGTIPSGHTNLIIEECIDSNNYMVLFKRKNSNIISLYNDTYDGKNVIVKYEKEKPYVKLCCNNVKVENCFTNYGQDWGNRWSCNFRSLTYDSTYVKPYSKVADNTAYLSRYSIISWDKNETNNLFFGEEEGGQSQGYYRFFLMYPISSSTEHINSIIEHKQFNNFTCYYSYTIPPIKNCGHNTCKIGYTVNFTGENIFKPSSKTYVSGNLTSYTMDGYIKPISTTTNYYMDNYNYETGIVSVTTLEKWGEQLSFYKANGYYFSPSDGLTLHTEWNTCTDYDPCDGGDGCCQGGDGCCQGGGTKYAVVKGSGASGFSSWPPSGSGEYWVPGGTETLASNYNPSSGGGYYFTWTASWGESVSAWVYSNNVEIVER